MINLNELVCSTSTIKNSKDVFTKEHFDKLTEDLASYRQTNIDVVKDLFKMVNANFERGDKVIFGDKYEVISPIVEMAQHYPETRDRIQISMFMRYEDILIINGDKLKSELGFSSLKYPSVGLSENQVKVRNTI